MDVVGPLPITRDGYRYLLTIIDFGTRFVEAIPMKKVDAATTCQALMQVFSCFGVPEIILTDNGSNFVASVTEEMLKHLQCTHIRSAPYHPQSNGMVERVNGVLKKLLDKTAKNSRKNWKEQLPAVLMALRNAKHTALGVSPYHLLFGRDTRTPVAVLKQTLTEEEPLAPNILTHLNDLYEELEKMEKLVLEQDTKAKDNSKRWYDKGAQEDPLEVGDQVLCLLPTGECGLTSKWEGPCSVSKVLGPLTYLIDKPTPGKKGRKVHRNALKRYIFQVTLAHVIMAEDDKTGVDRMKLGLEIPRKDMVPDPERWTKAVNVPDISHEQQQELLAMLQQYEEVFSDLPGNAKVAPFKVDTGQAPPVGAKPYTMPLPYWNQAKAELQNMEDLGIIEESVSPWSCPVICVPKKDGGLRLCMDYRKLNSVTVPDVYPLPNIEHLVQKVAGSAFISTMDLTRGYYQIPLEQQDRAKTAFVTAFGKWQFTKMPFGIRNAPAFFQRNMDCLLKNLSNSDAYIDDVCVYSSNWKEHLRHLDETLRCLKKAGLTVKLAKCAFARAQVQYLGHSIGGGKIAPVEAKVMAISQMEKPATKKALRRFLGMASYYRRFVPGFAEKAAPLYTATAKKEPDKVRWTSDRETAFSSLKEAMTKTVTLTTPDYSKPYLLKTDASGVGVGAVLEQKTDEVLYPIAFYSRKLTGAEYRYSASELEALAIIEAIKHFEVYLKGAKFTIETDHRALSFIQTMSRGSPKLMRWATVLQEHNCEVTYRPGPTNVVADMLSRLHDGEQQQQQAPSTGEFKSWHRECANSQEVGGDVVTGPATAGSKDCAAVAGNSSTEGDGDTHGRKRWSLEELN